MKCRSILSGKNIINLLSAELAPRVVKVNDYLHWGESNNSFAKDLNTNP